jgi:hypothetical protein
MADELPFKTASLDEAGFEKLLKVGSANPELAQRVADELEVNPRAVLTTLFRLSATQAEAIANSTDDVLRARALRLIERLRSGNLKGIKYNPGKPAPVGEKVKVHCSCGIEYES